jgi:hypothetical protein
MKSLITLSAFVLTVFSKFAMAQTNPQIRFCHQSEGTFIVANTENDQVGLCRFSSATIGALDLLDYQTKKTPVQSLRSYIDGIQLCEPYGENVTITIVQGPTLQVCRFGDGSMIDMQTLLAGREASQNAALNKALKLQ